VSSTQTKGGRQEFTDEPLQDDEKTMPLGLGMGEQSGLDPLASAGSGRKLSAGSLIIAIVVVIACGGLWLMRTLSQVSASTGTSAEAESTIEKFLNTFKSDSTQGKDPAREDRCQRDRGAQGILHRAPSPVDQCPAQPIHHFL
jgi:hypothetical protein